MNATKLFIRNNKVNNMAIKKSLTKILSHNLGHIGGIEWFIADLVEVK